MQHLGLSYNWPGDVAHWTSINGPYYYFRMRYAKAFNTIFPLSICITTAACKWNADLCLSLCASSGLNLLHSTLSQSIAVEGDWVRNMCGEGGGVSACLHGWGPPCTYVHIWALVQFLNGCVTSMIVALKYWSKPSLSPINFAWK